MDETFDLKNLFAPESFVLTVRGDAMADEMHDGDFVIVEAGREPRQGELVVATYSGRSTLRRYYRQGGIVTLRAANAMYADRIIPADRVTIAGVVVGLLRCYREMRNRPATVRRRVSSGRAG